MSLRLIGKKQGMTQIFDKDGNLIVCTVIYAEPSFVTQVKQKTVDGYNALQLASVKKPKAGSLTKPLKGHFEKAKVLPCRYVSESRIENVDDYQVGQQIGIDIFSLAEFVDVTATSKGKGYQGVIKLHGFSGGPAAHGSGFHRHAGSTGMRSTPGRCLPGGPRPSRMGGDKITVQNLEVIAVDPEKNLLLVKGSVPGSRGCILSIAKAMKKLTIKKSA